MDGVSRRGMLGFLGMAAGASAVPLAAAGTALLDPGRRVTHLPGGGLLIEDETFTTGISVENCSLLTVQNCTITPRVLETGMRVAITARDDWEDGDKGIAFDE